MSERPLVLVGADTITGEAILALLDETALVSEVVALGMEPADDAFVSFSGDNTPVQNLEDYVFHVGDVVICTGSAQLGEQAVTLASRAGAMVLDATPFSRNQSFTQLVHPAVNPEALLNAQFDGVIAVPGDMGMVLVPILRACRQLGGISRVDMHCNQSVSCYGAAGIRDLSEQTNRLLNGLPAENYLFREQIAFNLLPATGTFAGDMASVEREILELGDFSGLPVLMSSTIVPVFYGQTIQLSVTFDWDVEVRDVLDLFEELADVRVFQDSEDYLSPVAFVGADESERKLVHIHDIAVREVKKNVLRMNIVMDNIRAGSASGAVKLYQQLMTGLLR